LNGASAGVHDGRHVLSRLGGESFRHSYFEEEEATRAVAETFRDSLSFAALSRGAVGPAC